jgi:hypothetical protein
MEALAFALLDLPLICRFSSVRNQLWANQCHEFSSSSAFYECYGKIQTDSTIFLPLSFCFESARFSGETEHFSLLPQFIALIFTVLFTAFFLSNSLVIFLNDLFLLLFLHLLWLSHFYVSIPKVEVRIRSNLESIEFFGQLKYIFGAFKNCGLLFSTIQVQLFFYNMLRII